MSPFPSQRPIRVAILAQFPITSLDGDAKGRGGGQGSTWLPQLARCFSGYGDLEVHWVVLGRKTTKFRKISALNQTFHVIPAPPFSVDLALNHLPARLLLRSSMASIRPDIVHAWGTELSYPAVLQDCKCPTMLSMQGVLAEYKRAGGLPDDWRWRRMVGYEPRMIRSATIVTSESRWGIDKVRHVEPDTDCRMVEYGVHPDFYDMEWTPDLEHPYLVYIGSSGPRKGLDVLLEAVSRISDRNWELRILGDRGIQQELDRARLPGVRYLGMLPWNEMRQQLRHALAFTLPTRGDTSPNSVKEARVIGLPVITSLHGGQSGYIVDGLNGRIVDPLDAHHLAEAIRQVMSNPEQAIQLGMGNHEQDRAYLHPQRTAEGFAEIYRELAMR